jgi:DNA-binding NarL/FixJ family response regulator
MKIAIIDDDQRLARHLQGELAKYPEIISVICANSGLAFAALMEAIPANERPDVIIMDIQMSIPNEGIVSTQKITALFPDTKVVMFTISDDDENIFDAFKAGAVGYLLKNESPEFVFKTISDVMNGGAQMSPSIAKKAISYLTKQGKSTTPKTTFENLDPLSARELEILQLVSRGHTYQAIADNLFIASGTVKKHMANIFFKLQVTNKIEALRKLEQLR